MNDQHAPQKNEKVALAQKLVLAKRIGKGQLGIVYAAVHEVLARRFAVRVLRAALTTNEDTVRQLRHVVRETSTVFHPNIVRLTDFGQIPDGRHYVTMEFVRGIPLAKVLARDGRLPVARAVPLLVQLAEALEAAHALRVVHGDVKPSNLLVVEQQLGAEHLFVNDFALVPALSPRPSPDDPLGHLGLYGELDFVAPEQIDGRHVDGRADVYAFGATAYRMLAGEPPFVGEREQVIRGHRELEPVPPSRRSGAHDVPPWLDALVLRCLQKAPQDRYDQMEEVARELRAGVPRRVVVPTRGFEEEEVTTRWEVPPEPAEEPLPGSPARLHRLFYDTILELSEHVHEQGIAAPEMETEIISLRRLREDAAAIAAQCELTENRFEDIRRELRERESALRYAIIDLNLAKSDQLGHSEAKARDLDRQIGELERSLSQLGKQRNERFELLNAELQQHKDGLKAFEHQMAIRYRRLYAELGEVRPRVKTEDAMALYKRLERCRDALSRAQQAKAGAKR